MINQLWRRSVIGLCVLILMGTLGPIPAIADPSPGAPTPSGPSSPSTPSAAQPSSSTSYSLDPSKFSLTVSPTRLLVGPAELGTTHQVSVVNRGQQALPVTVQKRNFIAAADGSVRYTEDAPYAAAAWLTVSPATFEVAPGATQVVTVDIEAPTAPEPGDHQVALVFLILAGETDANVRINRGVGVPVYVTVPGPTDDSVVLTGLSAPGFTAGGAVAIDASVQNVGTVHRDFRGTTAMAAISAGTSTAFPDFTVPRGAPRDISVDWDPPLMCICHPTVSFANSDGVVQTATVRVIVFPWPVVLIGLGAVLLLLVGLRLARRSYRTSVVKAATALAASNPRP